jgi:folate-binding protein YgfZ
MTDSAFALLDSLGVLCITGVDAQRYLQGQLSADISALSPGASTLAGLHTAQGRVITIMRVIAADPQRYWLVLPTDLIATVLTRLQRYVLRAKVLLEDRSHDQRVLGLWQAGQRHVLVLSAGQPDPSGMRLEPQQWWCAEVTAGLPQVFAASSEHFTAQMLNLDLVGGVSFTKGCYTGQEVVARSHYRGRVKRRLQGFSTDQTLLLQPGERRLLPDGRMLEVVMAAMSAGGEQQLLAVAPLPTQAPDAEPAVDHSDEGNTAHPLLQARQIPLPYPLSPAQ